MSSSHLPAWRGRAGEALRSWKPWLKSTGPTTSAGKACSSRIAVRSGIHSRPVQKFRQLDRALRRSDTYTIAGLDRVEEARAVAMEDVIARNRGKRQDLIRVLEFLRAQLRKAELRSNPFELMKDERLLKPVSTEIKQ